MTPEEVNRTIEFLLEHSAQFTVHMDQLRLRQEKFAKQQEEIAKRHDRNLDRVERGLDRLRKQTARFQAWAVEDIAHQSSRLDQYERRLDKLPPTGN